MYRAKCGLIVGIKNRALPLQLLEPREQMAISLRFYELCSLVDHVFGASRTAGNVSFPRVRRYAL